MPAPDRFQNQAVFHTQIATSQTFRAARFSDQPACAGWPSLCQGYPQSRKTQSPFDSHHSQSGISANRSACDGGDCGRVVGYFSAL